ncbi:MAG: hypothetical protein Q9216_006382 [Gyalolechia sp. 2 TL-2023]
MAEILRTLRQILLVQVMDNGSFMATFKEDAYDPPATPQREVSTVLRIIKQSAIRYYPIHVYWQTFNEYLRGNAGPPMLLELGHGRAAPDPDVMEAFVEATFVRRCMNIPNIMTFSTMPNAEIKRIRKEYKNWKSEVVGYSLPYRTLQEADFWIKVDSYKSGYEKAHLLDVRDSKESFTIDGGETGHL